MNFFCVSSAKTNFLCTSMYTAKLDFADFLEKSSFLYSLLVFCYCAGVVSAVDCDGSVVEELRASRSVYVSKSSG